MGYLGTKPANAVLTSEQIGDGVIATADIADNAITTAKIAAGAVVQADLATGVAGTGPAFSAYQNASTQSIPNVTWTKVILPLEEFDTNNNFDSTTNYRFTPTVAGYYQINGNVSFNALSNAEILCAIYKNGSSYKYGTDMKATNVWMVNISSLVYLNGSTDYIELYVFQDSGASRTMNSIDNNRIWLNGFLARSA